MATIPHQPMTGQQYDRHGTPKMLITKPQRLELMLIIITTAKGTNNSINKIAKKIT